MSDLKSRMKLSVLVWEDYSDKVEARCHSDSLQCSHLEGRRRASLCPLKILTSCCLCLGVCVVLLEDVKA